MFLLFFFITGSPDFAILLDGPDDPSDLSSRAPSNWPWAQLTFFFLVYDPVVVVAVGGGAKKNPKKTAGCAVHPLLVVVLFCMRDWLEHTWHFLYFLGFRGKHKSSRGGGNI